MGAQRNVIDTNSQSWTPDHPVTLVGTAGHLHPGGLDTNLVVKRGNQRRSLFQSNAHYYEPAGAVSWDVRWAPPRRTGASSFRPGTS